MTGRPASAWDPPLAILVTEVMRTPAVAIDAGAPLLDVTKLIMFRSVDCVALLDHQAEGGESTLTSGPGHVVGGRWG